MKLAEPIACEKRFTDLQTDLAIQIVSNVISGFGQPLVAPEQVREHQVHAEAGDPDAYVHWMTAKLRMLYPDIPDGSHTSPIALLWVSIQEGHLECITVAESLDYYRAWEETGGGVHRAAFGSYFNRFCNTAVRSAFIRTMLG